MFFRAISHTRSSGSLAVAGEKSQATARPEVDEHEEAHLRGVFRGHHLPKAGLRAAHPWSYLEQAINLNWGSKHQTRGSKATKDFCFSYRRKRVPSSISYSDGYRLRSCTAEPPLPTKARQLVLMGAPFAQAALSGSLVLMWP